MLSGTSGAGYHFLSHLSWHFVFFTSNHVIGGLLGTWIVNLYTAPNPTQVPTYCMAMLNFPVRTLAVWSGTCLVTTPVGMAISIAPSLVSFFRLTSTNRPKKDFIMLCWGRPA